MRLRVRRSRMLLVSAALAALGAQTARAQVPFPSDVMSAEARQGYRAAQGSGQAKPVPISTRRTPSAFVSPTANPYLNPYLNSRISPDAALLYMLAAQRESGGIGSGALSGVRQAEGLSSNSTGAAAMPRSAQAPAVGAARYFHRGVDRAGQPSAAFFNRSTRRMGR